MTSLFGQQWRDDFRFYFQALPARAGGESEEQYLGRLIRARADVEAQRPGILARMPVPLAYSRGTAREVIDLRRWTNVRKSSGATLPEKKGKARA